MQPKFPIYIVSKGRWKRRLTSKALERLGVPYSIIVEAQEVDEYRAEVDPHLATVLVLDPAYQRVYDTCDELGEAKGKGPGPARNFAWDHSVCAGALWHWVMDDNIDCFYRLHNNRKLLITTPSVITAMEDFALRYENVAMVGPNYQKFAKMRQVLPPFVLNTRVYSCNLIRNDVPFRWRARYNEDTDLSLRMLKAGWCTVQFNAFLADKITTQTMRGGNTDEFYVKEGTLEKSKMQVQLHPDVSRLVWKFNRWHHHVDYRRFKRNQLKRRTDIEIPTGIKEYGMKLVNLNDHAMAAD